MTFLLLHLNVKACTYVEGSEENGRRASISVFLGRKFYQEPDEGSRPHVRLRRRASRTPGASRSVFARTRVPWVRATISCLSARRPRRGGGATTRLVYSYGYSLASRLALASYLSTLGRNKVGFTVQERGAGDRVTYVGGLQGVIERNAMRYHLAVQSYLATRAVSGPERFQRCSEHWFALTEHYPEQLFELGRSEYLQGKRRERANQLRLQRALVPVPTSVDVAAAGG